MAARVQWVWMVTMRRRCRFVLGYGYICREHMELHPCSAAGQLGLLHWEWARGWQGTGRPTPCTGLSGNALLDHKQRLDPRETQLT